MFKFLMKILKKVVISIMFLYGYNLIMQSFNLNIPINIITVLILSLFDTTCFLGLVGFYLLNFR